MPEGPKEGLSVSTDSTIVDPCYCLVSPLPVVLCYNEAALYGGWAVGALR